MDDPDFLKHLIGGMPIEELKREYEIYQEKKTGQASFELWLETLADRPKLEDVLHALWHFDQDAKAAEQTWIVTLTVTNKVANDPVKRRNDRISTDEIVDFWNSLQKDH